MHKLVTERLVRPGLWLLCLALAAAPAWAAAVQPRLPAPPDLGVDADGQALRLEALRGRVVVLSFWASWCAPCLEEMKVLENLQARVGTEQLRVIGVNWKQSRREFRELVQRLGPLALTLSSDPRGAVGAQFGVTAIPRLFVIDPQGRVAYSHEGYDPLQLGEVLPAQIAALLSAPEAAHAIITP